MGLFSLVSLFLALVASCRGQQRVMFVAGGDVAVSVSVSYDGRSFFRVPVSNVFSANVQGSCFSAELALWVLTGAGGNSFAYSSDALNWTGAGNAIPGGAVTCAWGAGIGFVAGGNQNHNMSTAFSPDGKNWTVANNTVLNTLRTVVFSPSQRRFAAVGIGNAGYPQIAFSTDGWNWFGMSNATSDFGQMWGVAFSPVTNRILIVGGWGAVPTQVAWSDDAGVSFDFSNSSSLIFQSAAYETVYIPKLSSFLICGGLDRYSTPSTPLLALMRDGSSIVTPIPGTNFSFFSAISGIAYSELVDVAVATGIYLNGGGNQYFYFSNDAANWFPAQQQPLYAGGNSVWSVTAFTPRVVSSATLASGGVLVGSIALLPSTVVTASTNVVILGDLTVVGSTLIVAPNVIVNVSRSLAVGVSGILVVSAGASISAGELLVAQNTTLQVTFLPPSSGTVVISFQQINGTFTNVQGPSDASASGCSFQAQYTSLSVIVSVSCTSGLSTGAIIGIAVGCAVGAILIIIGIVFLVRYCVKRGDIKASMALKEKEISNLKAAKVIVY